MRIVNVSVLTSAAGHSAKRQLPSGFFERRADAVAPDLLGCVVASTAGGVQTAGVIVETEAYLGADDPGSHAATKGKTARNAVMYGPPGTTYVYFTYGNHHMLNFVCEPEGVAGAVLIRALRPLSGLEEMRARRNGLPVGQLCSGPGKLCRALGIDLSDNGSALGTGRLAVYGREREIGEIGTSGRVGLSRGFDLQLRYFLRDDSFVSRARVGPVVRRRGESES